MIEQEMNIHLHQIEFVIIMIDIQYFHVIIELKDGMIIILIDILFQFHCDLPILHHLLIHQTRIIDNRCFEVKYFLNSMNRSEMLRYQIYSIQNHIEIQENRIHKQNSFIWKQINVNVYLILSIHEQQSIDIFITIFHIF